MNFMHRFSDLPFPFRQRMESTRVLRKTNFFQAILGLDNLRVKRIQGELALPFHNGQKLDWIQHHYGHRQDQRFHCIQNLPEPILEEVFQFLLLLSWIAFSEIPSPFVGEKSRLLQKRLIEIKEIIGSFDTSLLKRDYLMKRWHIFRDVGQELILKRKQLKDVMNVFEKRNKLFTVYISYIVSLFL